MARYATRPPAELRAVALTERHHEGPAMTRCFLVFLIGHPLSWAFVVGLVGFVTLALLGLSAILKDDRWLIASTVMSLIALGLVSCTLMSPLPLEGPP